MLKTQSKQLLGSLPLAFVVPQEVIMPICKLGRGKLFWVTFPPSFFDPSLRVLGKNFPKSVAFFKFWHRIQIWEQRKPVAKTIKKFRIQPAHSCCKLGHFKICCHLRNGVVYQSNEWIYFIIFTFMLKEPILCRNFELHSNRNNLSTFRFTLKRFYAFVW